MAEIGHSHTFNTCQAAFIREYLSNGGNATAAYKVAYPNANGSIKDIASRGARLLRNPKVRAAMAGAATASDAAVTHAVERYAITAERLADLMARLCVTELREVVDVHTETLPDGKRRKRVVIKDFSEIADDAHMSLVEVRQTAGGDVSVKLADRLAAMNSLARLKGWIADKPVDNRQLVMLKIER